MLDLNASVASLLSNDSRRSIWAPIFGGILVLATIISAVVVVTLTVKFHRIVTHSDLTSKLSERTRHLQLMLYRAQIIQLVFYFIFQIGPAVVELVIGFHVIKVVLGMSTDLLHNDEAYAGALAFTSFHSFCDYFAILYFIRPYRYQRTVKSGMSGEFRDFTAKWLWSLRDVLTGFVLRCLPSCIISNVQVVTSTSGPGVRELTHISVVASSTGLNAASQWARDHHA